MKQHPHHRQMPAEWEPHAATWLGWPEREEDWPGKLEPAKWAFLEIVRHLAAAEPVQMIVSGAEAAEEVRDMAGRAHVRMDHLHLHELATDRTWLRDCGAIFAREAATGKLEALQFQFNAWAKYDNFKLDQEVAPLMARTAGTHMHKPMIRSEDERESWMVLEGGAIDVNGAGIALITEECLASPTQERNPGFTPQDTEDALKQHLGLDHVIWLRGGIDGDDTHGHIDDCARFTDARTVVAVKEQDRSRPHCEVLDENLAILRAFKDAQGGLRVVELPMPEKLDFEDLTLPASYANFYIANGTVLVPTFNDPNDRIALGILQELFPDRSVRGIHCGDLVWGLGTIHCLTQQQPAK